VTYYHSVLDNDPLNRLVAEKLIRKILVEGVVQYADPHAYKAMRDRHLETPDVENVLRAGVTQDAEWEHGCWRYQVRTTKLTVVVEFEDEETLTVVTVWRN
jgi:hypothetical protein